MKHVGFFLLMLLAVVIGCKKMPDVVDAQPKTASDVVTETPTFSLLRAALFQAGLTDALKATNLTVFAPTDDAFKAKGFASADAFKNIAVADLRTILRYHLVAGVVTSRTPELSGVTNLPVESASTSVLLLTNGANGLFVNGQKVATADQTVANGVIHTIGTLLMPAASDAVTALRNRPDAALLVAAVTRAASVRPDLLAILNGTTTTPSLKQITLFAPTDAAFVAAGYRDVASVNAANPTTLANLLTYHVVPGTLFANQLQAGQLTTASASASRLTIATTATGPTVRGSRNATPATVKEADVVSKNAVIHLIDQVLQP